MTVEALAEMVILRRMADMSRFFMIPMVKRGPLSFCCRDTTLIIAKNDRYLMNSSISTIYHALSLSTYISEEIEYEDNLR